MIKKLIYFFLILPIFAKAQYPASHPITIVDGLPTNTIYDIVQDKLGYIWLGTEKGLVRYDGMRFLTYTNSTMRSTALSDLRFDEKGILRGQNFSGQHFLMQSDSLLLDTSVLAIGNFAPVLSTPKGETYFYSMLKVYRKRDNHEVLPFRQEVYGLYQLGESVYTFDADSIRCVSSNQQLVAIPFDFKGETVFFTASVGQKLLVFPRNKPTGVAYQFSPTFDQFRYSLPEANIQCVRVINEQLFIGTNNGLYVFTNELKPVFGGKPLLPNSSVSDVFEDADGVVWVSTLDNGLFKFGCWHSITVPTVEAVTALYYNIGKSDLYLGTVGGTVYKTNNKSTLFPYYKFETRQRIIALYFDSISQNLLVASDVFAFLSKSGKASIHPLAIKKIVQIGQEKYVLSRTGGVTIVSKKMNENSASTSDWIFEEPIEINSGNVRVKSAAYDSANGIIYAATTLGVLKINENGWKELKDGNESIVSTDLKYHSDTLFIASSRGLLMIKNGQVIQRWNASNSILPNAIKGVQVVNDYVWTNSGSKMYRLRLADQTIQVFNFTNQNEINDFWATDNQLFLATGVGLVTVDLPRLSPKKQLLQLHLEHLRTDKRKLDFTSKEQLCYDENNLKLEFAIPFFERAEDVSVLYKINSEKWQPLEPGQRLLNFISLQPGSYVVQLKAMASDGRTSAVRAVSFSIRAPFWKTWWFYTLSLLIVAVIANLIYRYRLKLVNDKNRLQQQKIELENKLRESILASVKAQMNPHFIFNALNTIQSFIYMNDKQNATEYLGKFSQLTRTVLDMSNKNSVSLEEEIAAIMLYLDLEKIRFDEQMNFTLEIAPNIDVAQLRIPSMIIQPYIENAVKHGLLHKKGERWLKCGFQLKNNMLKVTIDDNGIGRERSAQLNKIKNKQHQSFATQANEKRLEALNRGHTGAVNVKYIDKVSSMGEPAGTTVELMIAILED